MTDTLARLIVEASVLAGAPHPCTVLGHRWKHIGGCGRERPGGGWYSVPVHVCLVCNDCDYGENEEARRIEAEIAGEAEP
jgi:hypothetical protein